MSTLDQILNLKPFTISSPKVWIKELDRGALTKRSGSLVGQTIDHKSKRQCPSTPASPATSSALQEPPVAASSSGWNEQPVAYDWRSFDEWWSSSSWQSPGPSHHWWQPPPNTGMPCSKPANVAEPYLVLP